LQAEKQISDQASTTVAERRTDARGRFMGPD